MTQDPDGFQWHASRSLGPAGIGAALQAAGAEVTDDPASGAIDVCVNGRHLARVGTSAVAWHDATVAKFVRLVLLYHRMALALRMLADPAYDALLSGESGFDELPPVMAELASGSIPALCHTITYPTDPVEDAGER